MEKRKFAYFATLALLLICMQPLCQLSLTTASTISASSSTVTASTASGTASGVSFEPVVTKPVWVDRGSNGIADSLDQEIADRLANGTAQDYVNVTVELKSEPTISDEEAFIACGGYVTTGLWTYATYGFGGTIPYDQIADFLKQCPDALLVEKEAIGQTAVAYAAQQVGARTYVWNNLALQGDPQTSLAIIDTGIDASHVDFFPGYGNGDFSKKIVGWMDEVNSQTSPYDDEGHGSHCSGLAAGDGFFSTSSGLATTTWSANLGTISASGTYYVSGMMVNKTGTISVKVKWYSSGTSKLAAVPLCFGDKTVAYGSWSQVATVNTPTANTWYTLTYNVASPPSGGYDMYHILMTFTAGSGSMYVVFTMNWPYTPPSDGYSAWTGIAPQEKLVGVKVCNNQGSVTSTQMVNGLNWLIANAQAYHVTVASMSLAFIPEVAVVDAAVANLVNRGVTCVVAAGNSKSGGNNIFTPGAVDEVITAAAMNQFDSITSYSSQGGLSRESGGLTIKPDVTAPGGSFYGVPLYSADSNYNEAGGEWPEIQLNDAAGMQGTSMATPIVAGAAEIIVQAMGGYAGWQYTRSQALQPKMILCMTATETYPNLREGGSASMSPTLDRGGKDVHEGYGRINVDAAADAVLYSYTIGTTATATLGMPPTTSNIAVLGQRLAWARNVQLAQGNNYTFTLNVPAGADYDLYLYNDTGNNVSGSYYGEPGIVASSTTAKTGGTEQVTVTAPYTGTYYVVVKRATETTGSGTFTLTSSGPAVNAPFATFTEWTVPTSTSRPHSVIASGGLVYFTEFNANKIGCLNPGSNSIKEWTIPAENVGPLGMATSTGKVWFAEQNGNKIGCLTSSQNTISQWPIPTNSSNPVCVAVSGSKVWFCENVGNKIGFLNPSTNTFTEWAVPTTISGPGDMVVSGNAAWFVETSGNKIGCLNAATNMFYEWTLPTNGSHPERIMMPSNGKVWITETLGNKIGTFDPATGKLTTWNIPTAGSWPFSPLEDAMGNIYLLEYSGNKIAKLTPSGGTTTTLIRTTRTATPTSSVKSPTTSTATVTTKTVTPTSSVVAGAPTGQFVEWKVPTVGGAPRGLTSEDGTTFYITEFNGNKIAQLKPQNTFSEWKIPTSCRPFALAVSGGKVYFTENNDHNIARLDPATNNLTEWATPTASNLMDGIAVSNGVVWFTESSANKIGLLNLTNNAFTEWTVPTSGGFPFCLTVSAGMIWFTEQTGNKIGRFDPSTNNFTEWTIPTSGSNPTGIVVNSTGAVWFAEWTTDKVGCLNPITNQVTEWAVPTACNPEYLTYVGGTLWFTESNAGNKVARLNPSTNTVTEWTVPTSGSDPRGISVYSGKVWFTEEATSKIGKLYPIGGTAHTVTPFTNTASQSSATKTSVTTSKTPTVTALTPTKTYKTPLTSGAFTQWNNPTIKSMPWNIVTPGNGQVWFTELGPSASTTNKIGLLN